MISPSSYLLETRKKECLEPIIVSCVQLVPRLVRFSNWFRQLAGLCEVLLYTFNAEEHLGNADSLQRIGNQFPVSIPCCRSPALIWELLTSRTPSVCTYLSLWVSLRDLLGNTRYTCIYARGEVCTTWRIAVIENAAASVYDLILRTVSPL